MKRVFLFFLSIFILLAFSGCDSMKSPADYANLPEDSYQFGTDFPASFAGGMGIAKIAPTEDGYYFFAGGYLYFYDKETKVSVLACHRPECRHWDPYCAAYYPRSKHSLLQYYEGKLYAVINEEFYTSYDRRYHACLYEINPTDGAREKLCQLPYEADSLPQYMIHRGFLYMIYFDYSKANFTVERVAMNELKEKSLTPELIFRAVSMGFSQQPLLYGDHCFIGYVLPGSGSQISMKLFDINLETLEQTEIVFPDAEPGSLTMVEYPAKDGFLLTYASPELVRNEAFDRAYYTYHPETGEIEPLIELKDRGEGMTEYLSWDGKYWILSYLDLITNPSDFFRTNQEIRFYDENWNLVKSVPVDFCVQGYVVGDEDYMFLGETLDSFELYSLDKRGESFSVELIQKLRLQDIFLY